MNRGDDLRGQLERKMKEKGVTQGDVARTRGVKRQSVGQVFTGKRPIIGETLEGTLDLLEARLVVSALEADPQAVRDRAFMYGFKLFLKEPSERHETLGATVAWLTTGEASVLNNTLRSLAVQNLHSPLLSYDQAICAVLPLVYGPLTEDHKAVVGLGSEGDDWWDSRQVILWRTELGLG